MKRIRPLHCLAAATLLASAGAAHAEPAPKPQTDFTAAWQVSGTPAGSGPTRISYSSALGKMRIEMMAEGQPMTMIRDMNAGSMVMWSAMMPGMAMQVETGRKFDLEGQPTSETDTVSGEPCTIWLAYDAQVCVTADGIPVRTIGDGFSATMTEIERSPQEASLFAPPPGLQVMQMPRAAGGMMPGAGMANVPLPF